MKKLFVGLVIILVAFVSIAHAGPTWISDEDFAFLGELPGFKLTYDDFDDWLGLAPNDMTSFVTANDVVALPCLYADSSTIDLTIRMAALETGEEAITGVSFSIGDTRYDHTVDIDSKKVIYELFLGNVGMSLVKSIAESGEKVRVRLYYDSGNVDFDMTNEQIELFQTLYNAYEKIGGLEQVAYLDLVNSYYPIIIK